MDWMLGENPRGALYTWPMSITRDIRGQSDPILSPFLLSGVSYSMYVCELARFDLDSA